MDVMSNTPELVVFSRFYGSIDRLENVLMARAHYVALLVGEFYTMYCRSKAEGDSAPRWVQHLSTSKFGENFATVVKVRDACCRPCATHRVHKSPGPFPTGAARKEIPPAFTFSCMFYFVQLYRFKSRFRCGSRPSLQVLPFVIESIGATDAVVASRDMWREVWRKTFKKAADMNSKDLKVTVSL
jgi:hypothetical protein